MTNNQNCIELDRIVAASQSVNKQERDAGKLKFLKIVSKKDFQLPL